MADSFRMDMSGDKSYREDALKTAMDVFNENTRSRAVVKACEHARQDKQAKQRAIAYLAANVSPVTTQQVIIHLSTPQLPISTTVQLRPYREKPELGIEFSADK